MIGSPQTGLVLKDVLGCKATQSSLYELVVLHDAGICWPLIDEVAAASPRTQPIGIPIAIFRVLAPRCSKQNSLESSTLPGDNILVVANHATDAILSQWGSIYQY